MTQNEYNKYIEQLPEQIYTNFVGMAKEAKVKARENPELALLIFKRVDVLQSKHKIKLINAIENKKSDKITDEDIEITYKNYMLKMDSKHVSNYVSLVRHIRILSKGQPELALRILQDAEEMQHTHKQSIKIEIENNNKKVSLIKSQQSNSSIQTIAFKENNKTQMPFILFVFFPFIIFAIYQCLLATPRYESQAKVLVQQPDSMATMDKGMALLTGMGVRTGNSDTELVKAYIYSNDMIQYLNQKLELRNHFSQSRIDYFSRVNDSDTSEYLLEYYYQRVKVDIYEKSGVITIYAQAFDGVYAQKLAEAIVARAEWYINSIGHQLANAQLDFIKGEHENIEKRFAAAQTNLLNFQQRYNLLDPVAEGAAMQKITYTLEEKIAVKQTELKITKSIMSIQSPQVRALKNELNALKSQLKAERNKLAQSGNKEIAVSEMLAKFTDYKVKMELALQAYTSSQISLEKSRIEAYRQIKYLIVVENATLSESSKYPQILYNLTLFFVVNISIFAIGRVVLSVIKELK